MMLSNTSLPPPQVIVHFYEQDRSVKKWFRIVVVDARVTWICAINVCVVSTVLFLELREMLTVISLLDLTLNSPVYLFVPPSFVYPPHSSNFLIMLVPSRFEQGPFSLKDLYSVFSC